MAAAVRERPTALPNDCCDAQLLFTTPAAVVVSARVVTGEATRPIGLVIPRRCCLGDHPQRAVLLSQAEALLAGERRISTATPTAARRVEILVDGCWRALAGDRG
jgi:hypothetical protein